MNDPARLPPVSMLRLFFRMGGWFVVGIGVTLLILTLVGQLFFGAAKRFDAEGRRATAMVTEKYLTESTDSDGDRTVTHYLSLDYVTQSGEPVTITRSVSSSEYDRAREGAELDIWYLESAPDRIEVTRGSNARGARVVQIVALVFGLIWLGLLWLVGRWVVEALRARRYGAQETAEVTQVHRTAIRINNRPRHRLKWRDGKGREGQSLLHRAEDLEAFQTGSIVRIYHGLKRSWWAGDIGDRRA